jgi:GTPase
MFIDEVEITLQGGHGGAGLISFGKKTRSGPDGGNGGRGGDIYFASDTDLTLLNQFSRKTDFQAENGHPGGRNRKTGKDGADLEIKLPVGTSVIDIDKGELLFEMEKKSQKEPVCKGGKGGRGNFEFRSPRRTTPKFAQPGLPGEKRNVKLILKLIADFGLIGLPNAGKSSLLNELTHAQAKTAEYAFTTLHPNLGVLNGKVIADVPGLIEGASTGRGLGVSFLKHIEKVGKLLHCISVESKNPMKDYEIIRNEIRSFNMKLLQKPEIILITKSDLVEKDIIKSIESKFKKGKDVLSVSIHDWHSLEKLKSTLIK